MRRDIPGYQGASRDDTACANVNTAEDGYTKAYPNIILNNDGGRVEAGQLSRRARVASLDDVLVMGPPLVGIQGVGGAIMDIDIVRDQHVIANRYRMH